MYFTILFSFVLSHCVMDLVFNKGDFCCSAFMYILKFVMPCGVPRIRGRDLSLAISIMYTVCILLYLENRYGALDNGENTLE